MIKVIKLLDALKRKMLERAKAKQVKKLENLSVALDKAHDAGIETLEHLERFITKVEKFVDSRYVLASTKVNTAKKAAADKLDELNKL